jgi:hypothetical protein
MKAARHAVMTPSGDHRRHVNSGDEIGSTGREGGRDGQIKRFVEQGLEICTSILRLSGTNAQNHSPIGHQTFAAHP